MGAFLFISLRISFSSICVFSSFILSVPFIIILLICRWIIQLHICCFWLSFVAEPQPKKIIGELRQKSREHSIPIFTILEYGTNVSCVPFSEVFFYFSMPFLPSESASVYSDSCAGFRPFFTWIVCVTFIIFMLDNFLSWQPNNSQKSTAKSKYSYTSNHESCSSIDSIVFLKNNTMPLFKRRAPWKATFDDRIGTFKHQKTTGRLVYIT